MTDHNDKPRLIERAFPLKQTSIEAVHEKMCHANHIKALHIWPARRPLAACRAALIATLLPDPGNEEERKMILEKLGGKIVQKVKKTKDEDGKIQEKIVEETEDGILHWGRESGPDLDWFREKIREAYGGRAPKVLDPFAGGGAIPLEAMRLGCEVTAMDINPVSWFILKCTLEYPQKLAGKTSPLPDFAVKSPEFMESYFKARKVSKKQIQANLELVKEGRYPTPDADLADHVRAWGWWVMQKAKADLEKFYPTIDRKSPVAYLWARTVICKNCRATIPLLKTRWLCKKDNKRVLLTIDPNANRTDVVYSIQDDVPKGTGSAGERKAHDKRISQGTMNRNGVWCPCCGKPESVALQMADIRHEGATGRIGTVLFAVVDSGKDGKKYRLPHYDEYRALSEVDDAIPLVFSEIPFGIPIEPTPVQGVGASRAFSVENYGIDQWHKLFSPRQLLSIGTFVKAMRSANDEMAIAGYDSAHREAITSYLACVLDKMADYNSAFVAWQKRGEKGGHTFERWALQVKWDFVENNPLECGSGGWAPLVKWIADPLATTFPQALRTSSKPKIDCASAIGIDTRVDYILTDPPYYDSIPYSDCMDFFYVWLRRMLRGLGSEFDRLFGSNLSPKWDHESNDGELIDDASRFDGDRNMSKAAYEDGMFRTFQACNKSLLDLGRLVIVFANKQPDAWETLVSAMIRAGFIVDASWPIQTEMGNRTRALSSAALSSSVWLVCKKRPETAKPGWDNRVLDEMRVLIAERLRSFWDAGIRGPDFVWAATGPALEAYSKYPIVKKANEAGQVMTVSEFLSHVRRMVVDFVVGRVLSHNGDTQSVSELDDLTTYYILHRHDFGMLDAPIGPCILYAVSCGLSDRALADQFDLLARTGGQEADEIPDDEPEDEGNGDAEVEEGSGSKVKLKAWQQRNRKNMGYEAPNGRPIPIIDLIHRLMQLWKAGDVVEVNDYVNEMGLLQNRLFHQVLQAVIEMAPEKSNERSMLESISNHLTSLQREGIPVVVRYPKQPETDQVELQAEGFEVQAPVKTRRRKSK